MSEEQKTPPTKEELIAFFQEQLEVKTAQLQLQEINTKLAVSRAEEMKALTFIAQMTSPKAAADPYQGGTPHTITQEDLDNNPELIEDGIKVGDQVIIPNEDMVSDQEETKAEKKERSLKKK